MIRVALVLFAAVVFALIAFNVGIKTHVARWEAGASSAFVVSFLPFPDAALPKRVIVQQPAQVA